MVKYRWSEQFEWSLRRLLLTDPKPQANYISAPPFISTRCREWLNKPRKAGKTGVWGCGEKCQSSFELYEGSCAVIVIESKKAPFDSILPSAFLVKSCVGPDACCRAHMGEPPLLISGLSPATRGICKILKCWQEHRLRMFVFLLQVTKDSSAKDILYQDPNCHCTVKGTISNPRTPLSANNTMSLPLRHSTRSKTERPPRNLDPS